MADLGYASRYLFGQFRRFSRPEPAATLSAPADHGLTAEPFRVPTSDGVQIDGWVFAPPDPWGVVIACHARGSNKSRTLPQVQLLHEHGLAVVTFDFRGCGDSGPALRRGLAGLCQPLRDLEAVADLVDRRFDPVLRERVALLGLSFGGNMAIAHAGTSGRRYRALILDSTPLMRWSDMLNKLLTGERRGSGWPRLRAAADWLVVRTVVVWHRAEALYRLAIRSSRNLAGTPLLLILGERDTFFDPEICCRFLDRYYAGPATVWRVRRGRHLSNHVTQPHEYGRRVVGALRAAMWPTEEEPGDRHAAGDLGADVTEDAG